MFINKKSLLGFYLAGCVAFCATSVFVTVCPEHVASKSIHRQFIKAKYDLTNCEAAVGSGSQYGSMNNLSQTALGKTVLQNMQNQSVYVGRYPETKQQYALKEKASFFEKANLIALHEDDLGSLFHEGAHALQKAPKAWKDWKNLTGAYQTLLAREAGAHCLTVLDAYQRSLNGDSISWEKAQTDILPEVLASQYLKELIEENPSYKAQLKNIMNKPHPEIADKLISRFLKEGVLSVSYGDSFYALAVAPLKSDEGLNFTPLSVSEIGRAVCSDLYTMQDLPRTVEYLKAVGERASSLQWFKDAKGSDRDEAQRQTKAIKPPTANTFG